MTRARILALLLALSAGLPAAAQPVLWQQSINGLRAGELRAGSIDPQTSRNAVALDGAGDVFVAVYSRARFGPDCRLLKYAAATGMPIWEQTYSDGLGEQFVDAKWCAVAVDAAGDAFLATTRGNEFVVRKHAGASGSALWEGATASGVPADARGRLTAVALLSSGDVVASGSRVGAGAEQFRVVRFSGVTGAVQWESVDTAGDLVANAVAVDLAGDIVVTGLTANGDFVTAKYAGADGHRIWRKTFGGADNQFDVAMSVALDGSGNVFVTGYESRRMPSTTETTRDFKTLKYASADGTVLWEKAHNNPFDSSDTAYSVAVDAAGNAYVSGASGTATGGEFRTIKYAGPDGAILWEKGFSKAGNLGYGPYASRLDGAGNLVVTGYFGHFNGNGLDILTVKHAGADGTVLWDRVVNGGFDDVAYAVAIDATDNIVIAGYSVVPTPEAHRDLLVIRYSAAGTETWRRGPLNALVPSYTSPAEIAIDRNGDVIATGYYWGPTSVFDDNEEMITVKLSGTTGAPVWAAVYAGPWPDGSMGVGTDAAGDVLIAGTSTLAADGNAVVRLFKYAAATGQVLWTAVASAPGYRWGSGGAFGVDPAGNPVVSFQGVTSKYSGANGGLLWSAPVSGSVTFTSAGDLVVLGQNAATKLAGASGAVLWQRMPPPGSLFSSVVVDSAGNVILAAIDNGGWKIMRLSAGGAQLWEADFRDEAGWIGINTYPRVAMDAADGIYVARTVSGPSGPTSRQAIQTRKITASTGAPVWLRTLSADPGDSASASAIAVDAAGNPIVGGELNGNMRVLRYAGATGSLLSDFSYDGSLPNSRDRAVQVIVSGNTLYVAGTSVEATTGDGIRVIKLDLTPDILPDAFAFAPKSDIALMTLHKSEALVPAGYDGLAPVSVAGGEYSIGCTAAFTNVAGTIAPGQAVCVRHRSASSPLVSVTTTLTIGGVSAGFTTTTADVDDFFTNPRTFAQQQYRDFLGREADPAGLDVWTRQTADGLMTREEVIQAFFDSTEFQAGLPQVTRLYFAFFDRIPDYPGLLFHAGRYRVGVPLDEIAQDFAASEEFLVTYGALSNGEYVDRVYQNVLGRPADPAGRANALTQLDSGAMTRGELMVAFSESQEYLALSASEVFVTAIYVGMLRRSPDPAGLQNWVNAFGAGLPRLQMLGAFLASEEYSNRFDP